jgi:hypothetical protein
MVRGGLDIHQLAGLDDRERGFSRAIEFERAGEGFRAVLRYESFIVETNPCVTQEIALATLIETLQAQGYRQLKTQVSFRNGIYLGSQERWIEYPDPMQPAPTLPEMMRKLLRWFSPRTVNE